MGRRDDLSVGEIPSQRWELALELLRQGRSTCVLPGEVPVVMGRWTGCAVSKPHWTGAVTSLAQSWQSATRTTYDPRTKLYWGDFTLPVESGAYSFNIADGTLTCGTIDMNEVASSPGHELFQPADGDSWGATVAPGAYPTIEDTNPDQICVLTRPGRGPAVVSWNGVEFYEPGPATPGATT